MNEQEPLVLKNDTNWEALLKLYDQHGFDNIVISPGPGNPQHARDSGIGYKIIQEMAVPILGVCLGYQMLGYYFGATVVQAPEPFHGRTSEILHNKADPLFQNIPDQFLAVRYHSLMLAKPLPNNLLELAYTKDHMTNHITMAIRHRTLPLWGIQFHPESVLSQYGEQLFINFRNITAALL